MFKKKSKHSTDFERQIEQHRYEINRMTTEDKTEEERNKLTHILNIHKY